MIGRGIGLRKRVILFFGLGAALISVILAISVFTISRGYMMGQRERSAERQAVTHAELLRNVLAVPGTAPADALGAIDPPIDTVLLLHWQGEWIKTSSADPADLLPALDPTEIRTEAVTVPTTVHGHPYLAVAIPLGPDGDALYELAPLTELRATLRILRLVLIACAAAATLAGSLLGFWAAGRVLAPLRQLAGTTGRIASGDLDSRLPDRDPELAVIATSFNTMVDSLQQRIERERRFFGDVSHELRTPLTTLITSVAILARTRDDLPERSGRALDLITDELSHLYKLLDDLLALARTEAGLHQDALEAFSLEELITHTLTKAERSPELLTVVDDSVILGHKLVLERAFVNLMDNADRHGGGLTAVTVRRVGARAVIDFDDAGPGVAPTDRLRIFERFATSTVGRRSTTGTGTGLGLALVAESVSAHGGKVECHDRPGGGARFTITLPAEPGPADPAPTSMTPNQRNRGRNADR
ncbi:HAMP domain-containing sensor histidine kinase [Nocardia shimofusensis]|uniref:HAMP domain-containing sensor histidine kinase n=1 Tax=Nocardia shimofusensis TaxID=228596 RepID=UPI0009FE7C10|nr:HAMP domain-containing sensor histidine kinase [Nocardia shimofusensis]